MIRLLAPLVLLLCLAGCGASETSTPSLPVGASAAPAEGTPIAFGFLTSTDRYTALLPPGLSSDFADGSVVHSSAGQTIQYEPTSSFDLDLMRIRELPFVEGGITPTLFESNPRPPAPVLVWKLPSGVMWVVVRVKRDIDLIAAKMIVTEDEARLPRVRLEPPLTGPDGSEFFEREMHILYGASCIFVDAGAAAADAVSDQDGSYTATVATPFGVTVECNGESDDADEIKERAETIAASITPAE